MENHNTHSSAKLSVGAATNIPWDPFSDCVASTRPKNVVTISTTRYWQEIIAGAVALANAYSMISGAAGSGNEAQFRAIQQALDDIRRAIDQVNNSLIRIMEMLSDLPLRIRGIVDESLFKTTMGYAQAYAGDVSDFSKDAVVDEHQDELAQALILLNGALGGIKGVKGLTGVFLTGPLLSTWLCGAVALERSKMRAKPGNVPLSPWTRTNILTAKDDFEKFSFDVHDLDPHYRTETIPKFPKHGPLLARVVEPDGTLFLRNRGAQEIGDKRDYKLQCPNGHDVERLQQRDVFGNWIDVTDPLSRELTERIQLRRVEILSFFDFYPQFTAVEAKMANAFIEPPNIWS
ncbi:hypothetical protein GCM10027321_36480 [Massilia terrae]|uniref:Uncharacterized protein n=1 Tax=Massilia terrae TaxID=1811224 RepID=A0ABT2D4R4_9BURK|nr:hypothetical protein [Massilia terrae]MCS0660771.1 hypothetical protein [Massilia terrae]